MRTVTLVLCRRNGTVLGALTPFDVSMPWWQDTTEVVEGARRHHGVDITVLRLLASSEPAPPGGHVTYLAEVEEPPPAGLLTRWVGAATEDHPLRQTGARPGGPADDLAWADNTLVAAGTPRTGGAVQVRTWNLSSVWRLPIAGGSAWLKVVPPFFAHEGDVIARLTIGPPLLARDGCRMLLAHVAGDDLYDATPAQFVAMVGILVDVQVEWAGRIDELLALGAVDWRSAPLAELAADALARTALDRATRSSVESLLGGLAERMAAVAGCGIPDSIIHGDFHGGNGRGHEQRIVVLDWGDSGVGHPLLDEAAAIEHLDASTAVTVRAAWNRAWRVAVPGSDPARAVCLLRPVAALRQAVIYRGFLDRIEPAEHPYHRGDPAHWLHRAADACRGT